MKTQTKKIGILILTLALLTGCGERSKTLGIAPQAKMVTPVSALTAGKLVAVQGTMTEKCPVSGCWFILHDASGDIKVDTKTAGFVAAEIPLGTTVKVGGTLRTTPERRLAATGLRY